MEHCVLSVPSPQSGLSAIRTDEYKREQIGTSS